MTEHPAISRAMNIVKANEWEGDIRVNMTTVIGAGRVLAMALAEEQAKYAALAEAARAAVDLAEDCSDAGEEGFCCNTRINSLRNLLENKDDTGRKDI